MPRGARGGRSSGRTSNRSERRSQSRASNSSPRTGDGDGRNRVVVAAPTPAPVVKAPVVAKAKPKKTFASYFKPTPESIAKNKAAGAKHTASQRAKGIGIVRSNFTSGDGTAINGVTNSETNPALVKLAKRGLRGKEGLDELARQQAATLDKDTSFSGIWKSIKSGEKHKPVQSLLEFGKAQYGKGAGRHPPNTFGSSKKSNRNLNIPTTVSEGGGGGGGSSNQTTALGAAGSSVQPTNLTNMLAVKKNRRKKGLSVIKNAGTGIAYTSKGSGLNITT